MSHRRPPHVLMGLALLVTSCREHRPPRTVDLTLFHGPGIGAAAVLAHAARLQRFFQPYGLTLRVKGSPRPTGLDCGMHGTTARLDAALAEAQVPRGRSLSPEEEARSNRALGAVIFAGLRAFLREEARPDTVNVLLLPRLLSAPLRTYLFGRPDGPTLFGFGVSPALLAAAGPDDPQRGLHQMLDLVPPFPPLLVVGAAELVEFRGNLDNLLAHELGHALGLPHARHPGNLMTPGPAPLAAQRLTSQQVAVLHGSATAGPAPKSGQ